MAEEGITDIVLKRREDGKWEFEASESDVIDIMDAVRNRRELRMKQRAAQIAKKGALKKGNLKSLIRMRIEVVNAEGITTIYGEPPGRARCIPL